MKITLTVVDGPHKGQSFDFAGHDTFLVGRSKHAHFRLPAEDRYFSRVHFMIEVNPPACRLVDMGSHNGTYVNGHRVITVDLHQGDQIRAGHTVFQLRMEGEEAAAPETISFHADSHRGARLQLPEIEGYEDLHWAGTQPLGLALEGRRIGDGHAVSLLIVSPTNPATGPQVRQFLADAKRLATLHHASIRRLRELGIGETFLWFAFDHESEATRANQVSRAEGTLPIRRVLAWTQQLITGLEHAHGLGFVHRDIRPSGILVGDVDGKETARWAEYGLSRLLADAPFGGVTTFSDPEAAAFWPPEFLTDYRNPTPLGDQYSLAAAIYWLLTGHFIFDLPKDANRRFSVLLKQQVTPIRERRPEIPEKIALALERALARHPEKRHSDLAAFRAALFGK
ncbi:MAG: FHA domain-containing protein [Gemmataceae bacterium]|nr:FHA domain-containing protein [Gemmataceae bacterium]